MAKVQIDASVTKHNASPLTLGANRNHVHREQNWDSLNGTGPKYKNLVLPAMQGLRNRWGSSEFGQDTFIYRLGHGPTDGRLDYASFTGYHYENWFEADGKAQNIIPYDDIMHGLNEAETMGATPLMVVNIGTGWDSSEAGRLAAYCNKVSNAQRAAKNAARANDPYNVKYWELGNEVSWVNVRGHSSRMASEQQYAQYARHYAKAIRDNTDVDVKIAFCASTNMLFGGDGLWQTGSDPNNMRSLIRDLILNSYLNGEQMADAITFHAYPGWPVGYGKRSEAGSAEQNKMALTTFHKSRLQAVRDGIADAADRPVEIWQTEMFPHYYNSDPSDASLFGALYNTDWTIYCMNEGFPISVTFCMWQNDLGIGHNQFFYAGNANNKTAWFRWMNEVWSKHWGSAILPTTVESPTYFVAGVDSSGKGNVNVPYIGAAASKSPDGKTMYIVLLNRTADKTEDVEIDLQNFSWNNGQTVAVRKLKGNNGWTSAWNATSLTTTNWVPAQSPWGTNKYRMEPGSVVLLTISGVAVPPNNQTTPDPGTQNPSPTPVLTNPTPSSVPTLAAVRESGANVTRVTARWDAIEASQGVYDFTPLEQAVYNAKALGGRIVLRLFGTPKWATGDGTANGHLKNPTDWDLIDGFVERLIAKFKGQVFGYEIWTEPNNPMMYYPDATTEDRQANYLDLLTNYEAKIRALDTSAVLVLGGINLNHPFLDFLQHLYTNNARGKFTYMGVVAHSYNGIAWDATAPAAVTSLRNKMTENQDGNKSLVITSLGVGTTPQNDQLQAQRVARALALVHLPSWKVLFACYDPFTDKTWDSTKMGLRTAAGENKPAYTAYRTVAALLAGKTFVKQMTLGDGNWGLEFQDPATSRSIYVVWTNNEANAFPVELPLRTNHLNLVLPQIAKYSESILLEQRISFTLKKDVMIIQELPQVYVLPGSVPGQAPTTYDPTRERPPAVNLNNQKFELSVNGLCYLGATQDWLTTSDYEEVTTEWDTRTGHKPYVNNFEIEWRDRNDSLLVDTRLGTIKDDEKIPMVSVTFSRSDAPTTREFSLGSKDQEIREFAQKLKAYDYPVFLRLEPSFNRAEWSRACVANPTGMTANDYKLMWRKFYDIFKSEGVTNVAFVWCPNAFSNPNTEANAIANYYPGDGYVDWCGLDLFINEDWATLRAKLARSLAALGTTKPVMVSVGVADPNELGYNKADTLAQFFDAIEFKHTQVKGLLWYDKHSKSNDAYQLAQFPEVENVYEDRTASVRYIVSGISL